MKAQSSLSAADRSASESFMGPRGSAGSPFEEAVLEGTVIAGKYRVERVIGEGAMGVVLSARHVELDEKVALKFIRPEMHTLPDVLSRFAREAKASAHLTSEHVAKVLDVGVAPVIGPFLVMEYLDGQNLASLLQERGPLPVRRAAEYVMQVCEALALALAHAASITHRDVKPENLFLTRRGDLEIIKVLDFGISKTPLVARFLGGEVKVAETSCLMGTPLYMSPEQIRSTNEVDHRTDIWSLGVVLFELLTGRPAFAGETVTQVCALVLESQPPRLVELCPRAPVELGRVIERCLEKDPGRRFQSAAELANALLPFAPSRARLHAERAMSVLPGRSPPSDPPPASTMPLPVIELTPSSDASPSTVFGADSARGWAHPKGRPIAIALGLILCVMLGYGSVRLFGDSASSVSPPDLPPASTPVVARSVDAPLVTVRPIAPAAPVAQPVRAAPVVAPMNRAVRRPSGVATRPHKAAPAMPEPVVTLPPVDSSASSVDAGAVKKARARLIGERRQAKRLE